VKLLNVFSHSIPAPTLTTDDFGNSCAIMTQWAVDAGLPVVDHEVIVVPLDTLRHNIRELSME
jgi:hypothetical protein